MRKMFIISTVAAAALMMGGCARNHAGEGAGIGAAGGAVLGAVAGGDPLVGAAVGAAAGAAIGSTMKKGDGRCYRTDRDGHEYRVRC
ncbi:MAG TPA: hypothetical protein VN222_01140 [Novosphingobium sp.]|nr:hypothetical protein [Novosphingobium sp.]